MIANIQNVNKIIQDFTNKKIQIFDKNGYCMWQQIYKSEISFNKAFNEISKKFNAEIRRRAAL